MKLVLAGQPIRVRFAPAPRAHRGRLHSRQSPGQAVHAATFVRDRLMVLDEELLREPPELARILVHEISHFAWARLGNRVRRSWENLLRDEFGGRARGELGWSAEWRKERLVQADLRRRTRRWREYACESFCDSAAWLLSGGAPHAEFTLAPRRRSERRRWFERTLGGVSISI